MKRSTFIAPFPFLFAALFLFSCNPKTYDRQKNYDTAFDLQFVKELQGNNLFVRLQNNKDIIDNYRSRGKEKSAANWEKEDAKYNEAMIQAFKDSWTHCDVFFYDQELYFNTAEFPAIDINGKKHIVELEREQIFLGKFIEFCGTTNIANANSSRFGSGQTHFMLEKWPEDGSPGKKTLKIEVGGCLTRGNIRFLVSQMQRRLTRTYEGKRH